MSTTAGSECLQPGTAMPAGSIPEKQVNHPYLVFMLVLSLLALALLLVDVVAKPEPSVRVILNYADNIVCALFFGDFLIQFARARNKWRYFATWGWLDLASCIPTVDYLRAARTTRILRIFRILRAVKAARIISHFALERRAQSAFLAATLLSLILVTVAAIGALHFEVDEGNIKTPEDAFWWAVVTITTVGYGDRFPVTSEGRVLGIILMISGVGLFGTLSGFIASWFLAPEREKSDAELATMRQDLAEIKTLLANPSRTDSSGSPDP
ncbi:MAG: ion transporter [Candidatus Sumerlaeaceae bacterium]|nr:ion transporter [Candidatus Sumerlaeaceae bacterium]